MPYRMLEIFNPARWNILEALDLTNYKRRSPKSPIMLEDKKYM